ncbi:MAG: formamidopyrimidine-DNA glycosylase [Actinobacteria bacterium]|nr:formamidopyrimidine-DNA glycosylase [Actinomycetota bacterium]
MPELLEVEAARTLVEALALNRPIAAVRAPDTWYLKRGLTPRAVRKALPGRRLTTARRRGKLLLVDTSGERSELAGAASVRGAGNPPRSECDQSAGPTIGLHLGMSGRVLIDGEAAGDPLLYASNRENVQWHRFIIEFADGGRLAMRDPRRLGAVELDPDEDRLGVDALELALPYLRSVVSRSRAPLKAVLMDQSRIAGLGNLLVDEALWRAGLDPARPAESLDAGEQVRLRRAIATTLRVLGRRGGSHTGDLMVARLPGGLCPKDGVALLRRTVGGRTTYSCPRHQL